MTSITDIKAAGDYVIQTFLFAICDYTNGFNWNL